MSPTPTDATLPINSKEFNHYFKWCPYKYVDVYAVLELFEVHHPALQHAIKKLLVAGGRGHKDIRKDLKEARESIQRCEEMMAERTQKTKPATHP